MRQGADALVAARQLTGAGVVRPAVAHALRHPHDAATPRVRAALDDAEYSRYPAHETSTVEDGPNADSMTLANRSRNES